MSKIAIPKIEYTRLQRQAGAYRKLAGRFFESVIRNPIDTVLDDFEATGLYSDKFIGDLRDGLKKSSYGKKWR